MTKKELLAILEPLADDTNITIEGTRSVALSDVTWDSEVVVFNINTYGGKLMLGDEYVPPKYVQQISAVLDGGQTVVSRNFDMTTKGFKIDGQVVNVRSYKIDEVLE